MTVIAWDGKNVAVDSRVSTYHGLHYEGKKFREMDGGVTVIWYGDHATAQKLVAWYEDGAIPEEFPGGEDADLAGLVIIQSGAFVVNPVVEVCGSPYFEAAPCPWAWGSGSHIALGAIAAGADAEQAAKIACEKVLDCGGPVTVISCGG